jgi:hypothetical protein
VFEGFAILELRPGQAGILGGDCDSRAPIIATLDEISPSG